MTVTATRRPTSIHHKKRVGQHHKQGKHYIKVYWPYVPITIIVAMGLVIGNWHPRTRNGVLAYATQMSISTLLSSTNDQRASNGRQSLKINSQLSAAAQAKANDMTSRNYWSHNTPDGKEPWTFIQASGYDYQKAGENLAYGFNSSQDTVIGWMNSPSHRENLLDANYTEVGFGFANAKDYNKSGPETVVVAMYGEPLGVGATPATANKQTNPSQNAPVNTTTALVNEPHTLSVARVNLITSGQLPWAAFAVGLTSGILLAVVVLKHGLAFRKLVVEGEEFVIHHPWMDIGLVTIVMIGYVLSQSAGVIR
jgi:hypothetical protein